MLPDRQYEEAGACLIPSAAEVWGNANLVVKVKKPQTAEFSLFRPGLILFTYLHLAPLPELTARLREIDDVFNSQVVTLASNVWTVREAVLQADLVIGGVLIPGAAAPKLVKRGMISGMKRGAVIVDVCIDQGGCLETSRPTSHSTPVFTVDGVLHYCVPNMPAAVPHTSTFALTNATIPYLLNIADCGLEKACEESPAIYEGVNTYKGHLTYAGVAESQGRSYRDQRLLL